MPRTRAVSKPIPPERHGERRRREILGTATDLATGEGLEGLSIGRLAEEVGMSKSGVAAHFASKQDLQLQAVAAAAAGYEQQVGTPPLGAEPGRARVHTMMEAWIDYIEGIAYRGGCFFASAGAEFGSRAGAVRDLLAEHTRGWIRALEAEIRTATRLGELDADERLLAFQLHALVQEANLRRRLLDDEGAFDDARALLASVLANALPGARAQGSQGDRP